MTASPSSRDRAPAAPTIATIDFSRARIAVWEVGPPSLVIRASTLSRLRSAVSAGARSRATRTKRMVGVWHPGRSDAPQVGDDPLRNVVEVSSPLAHIAAHAR